MKKALYILTVLHILSFVNSSAQTKVGTIPGSLSVNESGAATYSIPLECPAGINGIQPNISLYYDSHGGSGAMGVGWNIGGLSSIIRKEKTIFNP